MADTLRHEDTTTATSAPERADSAPATRARAIRTPDQRLRVFVSSTLAELAPERNTAREAITHLRLTPVLFELGARPHPPRDLYRAYLAQSDVFLGIYWQRYGWVAPGMDVSGLEDEYRLSGDRPKLIYVKAPAPERDDGLKALLERIKADDNAAYKPFETLDELHDLIENDLALLLSERFEQMRAAEPSAAPISALDTRRLAIPLIRTPIVGREKEAETICGLLARDDVGLVTLTGSGGAGKTRLALHIASSLRESFADGVVFVSLAPLTDASLVAATIASALDLRESPGQPILDTLKSTLRDRNLLLVLDNLEQVAGAGTIVAQLLETCPRLKLLATSRRKLRMRGEKEVPIAPLATPAADVSAEQIARNPAVELFVQRAQEVKPDFALTNQTAGVIAEICRRLDGLPLAIELAAARIKVLPPKALLNRLDRVLPVLTSGAQDLPARQRTMQGAIAWSYDLLSEPERALFRRLAVFVGGCTFEALDAVCNPGGDLGGDSLDCLEGLVEGSLVREGETPDGDARYSMLATVREFALERLAESGEREPLQRRHAAYILQLVEDAEPHLTAPERWGYLARLDIECDNVRAALDWGKSARNYDTCLRLVDALGWYWFLRGQLHEGRGWVATALDLAPDTADSVLRAKALHWLAGLAFAQGDFRAAREPAETSVALFGEGGSRHDLGFAQIILGLVQFGSGDPTAARATFETAQATLRGAAGDERWGVAFALYCLGDATLALGDVPAAHAAYEESLALFDELGDRWGRAVGLHALGREAEGRSDLAAAQSLYTASEALFRDMGDRWDLARVLAAMQSVAVREGDHARARALGAESLTLSRDLGNTHGVLKSLEVLAEIDAAEGQPARAARLLGAVDAASTAMGRPVAQEAVANVRSHLDDAAFAAAWSDGHAATLDQALSEAISELAAAAG